jgi:hypothetical protein
VKTLRKIYEFDWRAAWSATKTLLAIYGAIALVAWFAAPLQPLEVAGAILFVVATWYVMFRFVQAVRAHSLALPQASSKGAVKAGRGSELSRSADSSALASAGDLKSTSLKPRRIPRSAISRPTTASAEATGIAPALAGAHEKVQMRRRFVYFDAEKGEEVYKLEPAA